MYKKEKQLFQRDPHPEIRFPGSGGGGTPYDGLCGRLHSKGVFFWSLPSGIWKGRDFTSWSILNGREICHLGLWKG